MLRDPDVIHKRWLLPVIPNYITAKHPRYVAFQNTLKRRRRNVHQMIGASHCFSIPFGIQKDISGQYNMILLPHNFFLCWLDSLFLLIIKKHMTRWRLRNLIGTFLARFYFPLKKPVAHILFHRLEFGSLFGIIWIENTYCTSFIFRIGRWRGLSKRNHTVTFLWLHYWNFSVFFIFKNVSMYGVSCPNEI